MAQHGQHNMDQGYPHSSANGCPPHGWAPGGGEGGRAAVPQPSAPPGAGVYQGYQHQPGFSQAPYGYPYYQAPATSVPQPMPKKRRGAGFWVAIAIAVLAVLLAGVLAFQVLSGPGKGARSGQMGQLDGKTAEEIQAELDRVVEEGMFNISIAAIVEFADGTSPGDLRIENVPGNPYLMKVDIQRQDNGERIYETDIIEQNHHIQSDVLDADLDPGTYECIARFHALDPDTEEEVGQAAAAMTIKVLG